MADTVVKTVQLGVDDLAYTQDLNVNGEYTYTFKALDKTGTSLEDATTITPNYSLDGSNLVVSADVSYKAIATFDVTSDGKYDDLAYTAGTYQFELKQVKSGSEAVNAKYAWICTGKINTTTGEIDKTQKVAREATAAEKALGYETVSMILDQSEFATAMTGAGQAEGNVTVKNLVVNQYVNGTAYDVTATYNAKVTDNTSYASFNSDLFAHQGKYEYTFSNFAREDVTASVTINNTDMNGYEYAPQEVSANTYMGSRLKEAFTSNPEDELFALGTGDDKLTLNTGLGYGNDTVITTADEKLNLNFVDLNNHEVTPERVVDGNNVVLSTETSFKATAQLSAGNYDNINYTAGTYQFELKQVKSESKSVNAKYAWICTGKLKDDGTIDTTQVVAREATAAEKALGYKTVSMILDNTDFASETGKSTAGTVEISGLTVNQYINGSKVDVTDTYKANAKADAKSYAEYNAQLFNAQGESSVTVKDYVTNVDKDGKSDADVTFNTSNDLETISYLPTETKENVYEGTRLNEAFTSTTEDETFTLKTGSNKLTFNTGLGYGDDTVNLTQDEQLNLNFVDLNNHEVTPERVVDGNNVVLSTETSFKATAQLSAGNYDNINYTAGTYQFELKQVKSESKSVNAKYAWICTGKLKDDGTIDTTQVVAREATAAEKALGYKTVSMILDNTDFASETGKSTAGTVEISGLTVNQYINGSKVDVTDTYKANAKADAKSYAEYNAQLFNAQGESTVTLTGYASDKMKDVIYKTSSSGTEQVTKATINSSANNNVETLTYDAVETKKNTYTGSRLNDTFLSTEEDEKINLGTSVKELNKFKGQDNVVFKGDFGNDTVTMNKDELLHLTFSNLDDVEYTIKGKNLVIENNVEYYATATLSGNLWGNAVSGEHTFELAQYHDEQFPVSGLEGKYMWKDTEKYADVKTGTGTEAKTLPRYWMLDNSLFNIIKDKDGSYTLTESGATAKNFTVIKVVNGVKYDVTDEYVAAAKAVSGKEGADYDDKFAANLYNSQASGSVTVQNYATYRNNLYLTDGDTTQHATFEVVGKKNVFTGDANDNIAYSTDEDETFNLKTGSDAIVFSGDFGTDTVKLTKGETVNLEFEYNDALKTGVISKEMVGNNLVITADVEYYATADVYGSLWGNTVYSSGTTAATAENPAEYRFEIAQYTDEQFKNTDYEDKYLWKATTKYADVTTGTGTEAKTLPRYLALDGTDFANSSYDIGTSGTKHVDDLTSVGGGATVHNLKIWQVVNGVTTDVTAEYINALANVYTIDSGSKVAAKMFADQGLEGTVVVKDFGKDTGASLAINGDAYAYTNTVAAADIDSVVVKGKVSGTSAKDVIDGSLYVSTNGTKGLTFATGSGDDKITGTSFNDTVTLKSLEGQSAKVIQENGTNKVTFGKGNDFFTTDNTGAAAAAGHVGGFSSNTVNMGSGNNNIYLGSEGTNKITAANGNNTIKMDAGVNTVKFGNGINNITTIAGQNKVNTGKGDDVIALGGGNNVLNTGAGADKFAITKGYNTIKTGAGVKDFSTTAITGGINNITTGKDADKFTLTAGKNTINSNAGDDVFTINGGTNVIKAGAGADKLTVNGGYTVVDGGAGNDTYDARGMNLLADNLVVTDKSGVNTLLLGNKANIFFDVTNVKTDKTGAVKSYKVGNEMVFTGTAGTSVGGTYTNDFHGFGGATAGVDITTGAKNAVTSVTIGYDAASTLNVNALAGQVANWLAANGNYKSAAEVFEINDAKDVAALTALYVNNSAGCYQ